MLKVLFLQPHSLDGCTWYRLDQFLQSSRRQKLAHCEFMDPTLDDELLMKVIQATDVYVCRLNEALIYFFDELKLDNIKKPIILDVDDNYEDVDPLSNMYESLGTREVKLPSGEYLWKDGEGQFNIKENKARLEKYREIMRRATAVIATTFELKSYVENYNKNVAVIPNAIDPKLFPPLNFQSKKEINIVWAGGASHFPDLFEVKPVLKEIMEMYPQVHYYHLGQVFESILKDLPRDRVHSYGWIKADGHGYRLACMNADIAIAPLKDMDFNRYKSSIKYYEYSALRIPTIAKNMSPYSDDIVDGENGLLYSDLTEFKLKLEQLIKNPIERITLGRNAHDYVIRNRSLDTITKDWVEFLEGIKNVYESING